MFEGNFQTLYYFFDSLSSHLKRDGDLLTFWQKENADDLTDDDLEKVKTFVRDVLGTDIEAS